MAFPNSNGDFMWFSYQLRPFTRNSHATPTFIMYAVSQSCSTCGTGACTDLCFNAATCNAARTKFLLRQPLMKTWWKPGEHVGNDVSDVFSVFYHNVFSLHHHFSEAVGQVARIYGFQTTSRYVKSNTTMYIGYILLLLSKYGIQQQIR